MTKPRIFIGSSTEGLSIARILQRNLYRDAEVVLWENDVFRISSGTLDSIWAALDHCDYGVFVLTDDDIVESRSAQFDAPRDNVIFELGLFMGRLGQDRTFWVMPQTSSLKIPSDLLGITSARYDPEYAKNPSAMLGPASDQIRSAIQRTNYRRTLTWAEIISGVRSLAECIKLSPSLGGYPVDIVIGLAGGGAIISDLLAKSYGGVVPHATLCVDRRRAEIEFFHDIQEIGWIAKLSRNHGVLNVLIVDDISRTGTTLSSAERYVKASLPNANIRTAALVSVSGNGFMPDYAAYELEDGNILTPFHI